MNIQVCIADKDLRQLIEAFAIGVVGAIFYRACHENRAVLKLSIDEMELSNRAFSSLEANGIKTIGDLVQKTDRELLHFRNFGRGSLCEVKNVLRDDFGLALRNEREPDSARTRVLQSALESWADEMQQDQTNGKGGLSL